MRGCRPLEVWEIKKAAKSFEGINAVRNKTILILGHNTGFRISVLLSLQIKDVFENGCVLNQVTVTRAHIFLEMQIVLMTRNIIDESCRWLWYSDIQAVGIPGAASWKEEWAGYLDKFESVTILELSTKKRLSCNA